MNKYRRVVAWPLLEAILITNGRQLCYLLAGKCFIEPRQHDASDKE